MSIVTDVLATRYTRYNDKKTFDLVVGVFLSAVRGPCDGALFVQPGSHTAERNARHAGTLGAARHSFAAAVGAAALHHAAPILAEPGTAIVFDMDLLHAGGPNLSPGIRYALYYRLRVQR